MLGSIAKATKWLFFFAALLLAVFAVLAFQRARDVRDVMANGVEIGAAVEGGAKGVRETLGGTSEVDIVWMDAAGAPQKAHGLWINGALAKQVREGGPEAETLMIKYLPGRPPVIVRQAAHDQERNAADIVWSLSAALVAALVGTIFLWRDRRKTP